VGYIIDGLGVVSLRDFEVALQSSFVWEVARVALGFLVSKGLSCLDGPAYSWAILCACQGQRLTYAQHAAVVQLLGNPWMLET
jgi:hypothetical protein